MWGKRVADDFTNVSFDDPISVLRSDRKEIWANTPTGFYNFFAYNFLMFYNWAHCTCITIKLPLFGCFVDTAWDLYVDPYLDIHFVPQKSAVGKLEHSGLLMLNSWDFCIQIWVWMRAQRPWPSLTTQSWSWKDLLDIRPFRLFSQECALWVQVILRAPWQWTCCCGPWVEFWFSTVCHQIHFDSYWGKCHKPRNAKALRWGGQKAWNNSWENILSSRER